MGAPRTGPPPSGRRMKAFKKLAGLAEALAQEVPTGALTGALPVRPAATQV